ASSGIFASWEFAASTEASSVFKIQKNSSSIPLRLEYILSGNAFSTKVVLRASPLLDFCCAGAKPAGSNCALPVSKWLLDKSASLSLRRGIGRVHQRERSLDFDCTSSSAAGAMWGISFGGRGAKLEESSAVLLQ